jgi:hypothetical protein
MGYHRRGARETALAHAAAAKRFRCVSISRRKVSRISANNESGEPRGVHRRQCSSARQHVTIRAPGNSSHNVDIASFSSRSLHAQGPVGTKAGEKPRHATEVFCPPADGKTGKLGTAPRRNEGEISISGHTTPS